MIGIKVPGRFVPGTVDGVVTEARWVKGTYIVVKTVEEANLVPMSVRVDGTLVYVVSTDTEYRWVAGDWEVIPKSFSDAPTDGKIYARQNGLWTVIDLDSINTSIESIIQELGQKANSSDLSNLQEQVEQIDASLANYVPRTELQNYTKMEQGPLPEKGEANTLYFVQSGTDYYFYIWWNDVVRFVLIGSTDVDLSQYYTKSEVDALLQGVEEDVADLQGRMTTAESEIDAIQGAGYQTAANVNSLIANATIEAGKINGAVANAQYATQAGALVNSITINVNGTETVFNGGEAASINITAAGLGALTSVPVATNEALGGIKVGFTSAGTNYAVELDGNNAAFVNVPVPEVPEYTAGDGILVSGHVVSIADNGVTTAKIADNAVTDAKIASVSTDKLTQGAEELILNGGTSEGTSE